MLQLEFINFHHFLSIIDRQMNCEISIKECQMTMMREAIIHGHHKTAKLSEVIAPYAQIAAEAQ